MDGAWTTHKRLNLHKSISKAAAKPTTTYLSTPERPTSTLMSSPSFFTSPGNICRAHQHETIRVTSRDDISSMRGNTSLREFSEGSFPPLAVPLHLVSPVPHTYLNTVGLSSGIRLPSKTVLSRGKTDAGRCRGDVRCILGRSLINWLIGDRPREGRRRRQKVCVA